ncbi:MAG TPA: macro domain-containing protein [Planctomycetaceae bacterium]|nr:macro domain-containing protein [Planctomycetaceae bacterium]
MEGDITTFAIDAVISNDDVEGRMWAAVASSIKSAAGADIERDSVSRGPYSLGSAWFTYGGNLPTKGVIHVAAMDRNGKSGGLDTIRTCVRSALEEAVKRQMESVALAPIGTYPQTVALDTWLKEIAPEVLKFFRDTASVKLAVLLVLYEPDNFNELVQLLRESVRPLMTQDINAEH